MRVPKTSSHERCSERSYLFTMSDSMPPHCLAADGCETFVFSRTSFQLPAGGARRDRTDDLLLAKQALSQLSYGPRPQNRERTTEDRMQIPPSVVCNPSSDLVGLDRLERSTSPLSGVRSNHLSYRPESHTLRVCTRPAKRFRARAASLREPSRAAKEAWARP